MSFKLLFSIIFVSLLLSASVLGYRLFAVTPTKPAATSQSNVTSGNLLPTDEAGRVKAEEAEYIQLLKTVGKISKLNDAFFQEPVFTSLSLYSFPIPVLTPGRSNPFAPVGAP